MATEANRLRKKVSRPTPSSIDEIGVAPMHFYGIEGTKITTIHRTTLRLFGMVVTSSPLSLGDASPALVIEGYR
jgi:hypothetical protein